MEGFRLIACVKDRDCRTPVRLTVYMSILSVAVGLFIGCSDRITNPPASPADTSSNGGDGGNGGGNGGGAEDYGQLYFSSGPTTPWLAEGPVRLSDGNIIAENSSDTDMEGSCTLLEQINFGEAISVAFTWRESKSGRCEYRFSVSDNLTAWQEIPYGKDEIGPTVARFEFFLSTPIYCRFEFSLPPSSEVALTEIRAYGR